MKKTGNAILPAINIEAVGKRIKQLVQDEPKAFAYEIGISVSALYNYTNGERIPATDVLFRMAKFTGRSMDWIVEGDQVTALESGKVRKVA